MAKARQFWVAVELLDALVGDEDDLCDAHITLCVHAGIGAADVICCARLGDHNEAVTLLQSADKTVAKHLSVLLDMKKRSGYSSTKSSSTDRKRAERSSGRYSKASNEFSQHTELCSHRGLIDSVPSEGFRFVIYQNRRRG
jgi:hypothetical protein